MSNAAKTLFTVGLIAGAAFSCLVSCRKQAEGEIKIGVVLPLTGPSANHGQDAKDGMQMAMEQIASSHLLKGKSIRLIYEDNQSRPADALSAAKKLIEVDHVKIIMGPIASTVALAMIPVTEEARVLLFSPAASSPELTGKGKLFFRTSLLAAPQGVAAARYISQNLKHEAAAILFINDDTGRGYADSFEHEFSRLGGRVLVREQYEKTDDDFRTQILKLRTAGAKIVYTPAVPRTLGLIVRQSHELGLDAVFVSNYGAEGEDLLKIAGDIANDRVFLTSFRLSPDFVAEYRARFKKEPGIAASLAYDALLVLSKAIAETHSTEPMTLSQRLRSLEIYEGATGRFSFDEHGDPIRDIVIRTVSDGIFAEIQQ